MHTITSSVALALALTLGSPSEDARTASEFLSGGSPSFVLGTVGDDFADRGIASQVQFIQGILFPQAAILEDAKLDASSGPEAWPARPVLYGGAHLNSTLASIADCLPFRIDAGVLEIGGETYAGDEYRLIALVPTIPASETCPGAPQFLLYAGAGSPGVTEINATPDGNYGFVVIDRFGMRDAGIWGRGEDGRAVAKITHRALRKPWRESRVHDADELEAALLVQRLQTAPTSKDERAQDLALLRGVRAAEKRLGLPAAAPLTIYLYEDAETKASITRGGDGHADQASRSLHLIVQPAGVDGPLEKLCTHEAIHVIADENFGVPGSALWGEGLAVWAAGRYGRRNLTEWRLDPPRAEGGIVELTGAGFRRLPERISYPIAGLLVGDLINAHGLEAFLEHIYPAGPDQLSAACAALELKPENLDALLRRYREH